MRSIHKLVDYKIIVNQVPGSLLVYIGREPLDTYLTPPVYPRAARATDVHTPTNISSIDIVKSSQVVGLRTRVAIIRTLIFSSPHPYAGSGEV